MIRIGILGAGFMGRGHYDRYQKIPGVQVTAWADAEAERRKGVLMAQGNIDLGLNKLDMSGVTTYAGATQLIAKADVDVVVERLRAAAPRATGGGGWRRAR